MPVLGATGAVYISGESTAFSGEACTLVSGTTYQINTAAKRAWNPAVPVTVYDGVTPLVEADGDFTVNYLFGKVTLAGAPAGAVTVDGEYLPLYEVTTVKGYRFKISADIEDATVMSSTTTAHARVVKTYDGSLDLTLLEQGNTDYDDPNGVYMDGVFTGAAAIYVRCKLGAGSNHFACMAVATSDEVSGEAMSLVQDVLSFQFSAGVLGSSFAFSWQ